MHIDAGVIIRPGNQSAQWNRFQSRYERLHVISPRRAPSRKRWAKTMGLTIASDFLDSLAILEYSLRQGESPCSRSVGAVFGGWFWLWDCSFWRFFRTPG